MGRRADFNLWALVSVECDVCGDVTHYADWAGFVPPNRCPECGVDWQGFIEVIL